MLLKHLYDFAVSRKLLDDLAFAPKAVRWIVELDVNGNLLGAGPQATGDDKRGKEFSCPHQPKRVAILHAMTVCVMDCESTLQISTQCMPPHAKQGLVMK